MRESQNTLLWTELVHSASDLLKFINDRAFDQALLLNSIEDEKIEHFLACLDSLEILVEIGSFLMAGPTAKWVAISIVQLFKCTWRVIFIVKKKKLLRKPLLNVIDRSLLLSSSKEKSILQPRRSRRFMDASPLLNNQQMFAELIYVFQPLIHLSSLGIYGMESWKPWISSLICDLISQSLHLDQSDNLSLVEKTELYRRRQSMLIYLLRSPLYDLWTKKLIIALLTFAQPKIPFSNNILDFLMAYIPHYRRIYAYLWSK